MCEKTGCRFSDRPFPRPFRFLIFDNDSPTFVETDSIGLEKLNGFSVMKLRAAPFKAEIYSSDMTLLQAIDSSFHDPTGEKTGLESSRFPLLVGRSGRELEDYWMKITFDVGRGQDRTFIMNSHFLECKEAWVNGERIKEMGRMGSPDPSRKDNPPPWWSTTLCFETGAGTNTLTLAMQSTASYTVLKVYSIMIIQGKCL